MGTTALSLFDYLDYREFLRDFFLEQKRNHFYYSFRYLAQKVSLDPAHIARVFQCKRHLSEKSLAPFISLCKFTDDEKRYFERLFTFNMARSERAAKQAFEELLSCCGVKSKTIRPEQYRFYTKWYYTAVRALIAMQPFAPRNYAAIARSLSPQITASEAKDAVRLLLQLGLIDIGPDKFLRAVDTHITTGLQWRSLAVNAFQRETIKLAGESIERHPREARDISTVTVGIKKSRMDEIRQRIADFRTSIMHIAEEDTDPDDIYQLNIQLFPLTDTSEKGKSK
jgi:uncharacterized protein (TIGR02147 family)